jgi:hypothetical protein
VNPLEDGEMPEQLLRARLGIDAELLGQVAERLPHGVHLLHDVEVAEVDGADVRLLERGEDAHQRRLAGTVRAEQAVHSRRNRERHVLQRLHAVGIGLRYVANV